MLKSIISSGIAVLALVGASTPASAHDSSQVRYELRQQGYSNLQFTVDEARFRSTPAAMVSASICTSTGMAGLPNVPTSGSASSAGRVPGGGRTEPMTANHSNHRTSAY